MSLEHSPDVLAITETRLSTDIGSEEVFPGGYSVVRKDRETRGGGVALLFKNNLKSHVLPDAHRESVWCKLLTGRGVLFVGVLYGPPGVGSDFLQTVFDHLKFFLDRDSKVIFCGDFNLDGINWVSSTPGTRRKKVDAEILLDVAYAFGLSRVIIQPTLAASRSSLLDLVFVSATIAEYQWDAIGDYLITQVLLSSVQRFHNSNILINLLHFATLYMLMMQVLLTTWLFSVNHFVERLSCVTVMKYGQNSTI